MIEIITQAELVGDVIENEDLSGLVLVNDCLLVGSDEGHALQLFVKEGNTSWRTQSSIELAISKAETDLEAVGYAEGFLYAVGSLSRRQRTKMSESVAMFVLS